jgi:hypothetical protein
MAKRRVRVIKIDGGNIVDDTGCSIRSALEQAGIENVVSVVSGGEIIQAADFDRPLPAYDMLTNHKPIEKGASLRDRLLDYECTLIATRFLVHFDSQTRTLELDEDALIIRAFPLPDDYSIDQIDLLFVICGYPDLPPAGVHIPSTTPNKEQIREHLGGHVMATSSYVLDHTPERYRKYVEELNKQGWDWICFHFKDWSWNLKPYNLLAGDCLFKYVENVFAALSGGHRG